MTTTNFFQIYRPQIRADIVLGPPMLDGSTVIHYIKDTSTDWYYRIRAQEYFLISRMDGTRTLQEIAAEYEAVFHRRLAVQSWTQLFRLLEQRALLQEEVDLDRIEMMRKDVNERRKKTARKILQWRFPLSHPDHFLERLLPRVRFAFHPAFVYPALVAMLLLEIFYAWNARSAVAELSWGLSHYQGIPFFLLLYIITFLFFAIHELAHGLTCKRFGGSVQEIGIQWRYVYPFAYCKIDDVMLFHNRWHRVYTAFAGVFMNLLMVLPFAFLWSLSPTHSFVRTISVFIFSYVNLTVLSNLLPFAQLDGYRMLNYALNMADLRKHALNIWLQGVKRIFFRKQGKTIHYEGYSKYIYLTYGFLSIAVLLTFVGFLLFELLGLLRMVFHF